MEEKERNIQQLVLKYQEKMARIQLPEMDVEELLDLINHYMEIGLDFEAEMYKRIAGTLFPDDPNVKLLCAHWEADEGNWKAVEDLKSTMMLTKQETALFEIENHLKHAYPDMAYQEVLKNLSPALETEDQDFLFDCAEVFRDYGYMDAAKNCLEAIPPSYPAYNEVVEFIAACLYCKADFDGAIQYLDRAIDLNPFDEYLWSQIGYLHYSNGNFDKAVDACEYALAINKDYPRALQLKEMIRLHKDGEHRLPDSSLLANDYAALTSFANLHFLRGDYNKAEAAYRKAFKRCPRQNNSRMHILFKIACCQILKHQISNGITTFHTVLLQDIYLWPYALELMGILLNEEKSEYISRLLLPIIKTRGIDIPCMERLIADFTSHNCYTEVREIWERMFKKKELLSPVFQDMIEIARGKLGS